MVVVFPREATIDEVRAYYDELRALLERPGPPLWFLVDLSTMDVVRASPLHRKTAADEFRKIAALFEKRVVGEAFVFSNPLIEGVYVAFTWMTGGPAKVVRETFSSEEKARAWIADRAGVSLANLPRFASVARRAS
ncbi:hypothetical protein DB32_002109 [Sandaracinus amylolyticus]|uniref:STAS/SEC14 domain-containing protein n=1 Tax=Sandaracinus amylolyticus TaxID=927083 RepID=A0A0F6YGQ5_9BACT|nr:hypothetical protein DB32_002109 [Sandaracinus amylolyticus]